MYWNGRGESDDAVSEQINYNMRCIETESHQTQVHFPHKINYNMRCIETHSGKSLKSSVRDKLQHEMYWNVQGKHNGTDRIR